MEARQQRSASPPPPLPTGLGLGTGTGRKTSVDLSRATLEGPAGKAGLVRLNRDAWFRLAPLAVDREELDIRILTPAKSDLPYTVSKDGPDSFRVFFTPAEIGTHSVAVRLGSQRLEEAFKVFEPDFITVSPINGAALGDVVDFSINASAAGYGNLEIAVTDADGTMVHSDVAPLKLDDGTQPRSAFRVSFKPRTTGLYLVSIKFNGVDLKGPPFLPCHPTFSHAGPLQRARTRWPSRRRGPREGESWRAPPPSPSAACPRSRSWRRTSTRRWRAATPAPAPRPRRLRPPSTKRPARYTRHPHPL